MLVHESKENRVLMGRLEKDDDLIAALYKLADAHGAKTAEIRALGAVTDLEVTEWDPNEKAYRSPVKRSDLSEVLMLYGNLSLKDENPFWHLHLTGAYIENGSTHIIAGHLLSAKVFALEFVIRVFDDLQLTRTFEESTGLSLWK